MITYPTKLQKVLLSGGCLQNGTPTPDNPVDIVCNNGVIKVSPNLFNKNQTFIAGYVSDSGEYTALSGKINVHRCYCIECKPNTTYKASGMTGNSCWGSFVNNTVGEIATSYVRGNSTITTGANDRYIIGLAYTTDGRYDYRNTLQIEQGSMATPYYPYGEIYTDGTQEVVTDSLGNTANAEMLLSVGDYKDTQEVITGSVTRNIGITILDGTEDWTKGGNYNQFYSTTAITDRDYSAGRFGYCTHFTMTSDASKMAEYGYYILGVQTQQINFSSVGLSATTVAEWKQWLADQYANGTPVIIVYLLATPTTEQVTPQPLAGNSASITAGSIDNLPINTDIHANMKHRFVTDSEGKRHLVDKVYVGNNLVFEETELVDMGLPSGTLWAKSNLDVTQPNKFAASPYQYECSFVSWGNIDAHNPISETEFDFDFGGVNAQAPWYEGQPYGSTTGAALTTDVPPSLDVARRELGGPWRMPTREEFAELIANITFMKADGVTPIPSSTKSKIVTVEGMKGIYLKSNINGNMLFFACLGSGTGTQWNNRGTNGGCWSASFFTERDSFSLDFRSSGVNPQGVYGRYLGRAVRPVYKP